MYISDTLRKYLHYYLSWGWADLTRARGKRIFHDLALHNRIFYFSYRRYHELFDYFQSSLVLHSSLASSRSGGGVELESSHEGLTRSDEAHDSGFVLGLRNATYICTYSRTLLWWQVVAHPGHRGFISIRRPCTYSVCLMFNPYEDEENDLFPGFKFGCEHDHKHLCDGVEELMHLLYVLGLKSPHDVLRNIGISVEGKRYFWSGKLIDRGYWPPR